MFITDAYKKLRVSAGYTDDTALKVIRKWNELTPFYSKASTIISENLAFYKGDQWDSEDLKKTDRIHRVYNYGASLLRKFQAYEGAKLFDINVKSDDDELSQVMGEAAESLLYKIIESARFWIVYVESRLTKSLYGSVYYLPVWQPSNKAGSKKGTVEIRVGTPDRTRVGFTDSTFSNIEYAINIKRVRVESARRIYADLLKENGLKPEDLKADRDIHETEYVQAVNDYMAKGTNSLYALTNDNHVTVFNYTDTEKYQLIIGQHTLIDRKHRYKINGEGFCPAVHEPNISAPDEHVGLSDLHFIMDQLKALNKLYSLLEEVIEDNAYPIMFEVNNALRGRKLKRGEMRGKVTPMTVEPGEEGIRMLQPPAIVQPILAGIAEVKASIFDVASMPAAAFGAYQPNTKSGFQATVQMQPALQEVDMRHVRTADAMKQLLRYCLAILEAEDKDSLTVELPEERDPIDGTVIAGNQKIVLENLAAHDMDIVFGNPLPKDDARVIQNETAKEKNGYQSRRTTMQVLGVENPTKEQSMMDTEKTKLAEIDAKVQEILLTAQAKVQQQAAQAQAQMQQQQGMQPGAGNDQAATGAIKSGQAPEQAFPRTEGSSPVADTAREAVADTSVL